METFVIVYLSRMSMYLLAAYIAFSKRAYWLGAVATICAIIGTTSFVTRDEMVTGVLSNLLGLLVLIAALDVKRR